MRDYLLIFFCGLFGGAAPSLLDLATKAQTGQMPGGGFYIALAIFGVIGGFIALVYRESVTHKAFLLGIGAPALIVAGGSVADQRASLGLSFEMFPSAYAQEIDNSAVGLRASEIVRIKNKDQWKVVVVKIDPKIFGNKSVETQLELNYQDLGKSGISVLYKADQLAAHFQVKFDFPKDNGNRYALIPNTANSTSLEGTIVTFGKLGAREIWNVRTNRIDIPTSKEDLLLTFDKKQSFWGGFYDAIGMKGKAKVSTNFTAEIKPIELSYR